MNCHRNVDVVEIGIDVLPKRSTHIIYRHERISGVWGSEFIATDS
jgi:hypothetical protein